MAKNEGSTGSSHPNFSNRAVNVQNTFRFQIVIFLKIKKIQSPEIERIEKWQGTCRAAVTASDESENLKCWQNPYVGDIFRGK